MIVFKNVKSGHGHPIVCLDAGHYGKYNRSPVVPEYYESDMTWKLHLYLKVELESYGIEVRQTRAEQGRDMELTARGRASNGCDLFLSIHSNACGTEGVDRTEGIHYVARDGTAVDDQSKEIAAMLAQTVYEVMDNHSRPKVYSKLASSDRNLDGVKNDNYYGVLHGAWMVGTPGLILEHSYHTNTRAARWLLDDNNLRKLAQAEARTIAEWFGAIEVDPIQLYRIRRSWDNAASQVGAYKNLSNAKSASPEGYTVYDESGNAVYTRASGEIESAKERDDELAGAYRVVAQDGFLNLRIGPGADRALIEKMPNGKIFRCYGYHTGDWLYGISESGAKGHCHRAYLQRK